MSDLISTIGKIERFSPGSLMSGSEKVLDRLSGLSESMKKRAGNFFYDSESEETEISKKMKKKKMKEESKIISADTITLFAVNSSTGIMKSVLYESNLIKFDSPAWDLLENKEDVLALNISNIPDKPKWIPFRLSLLVSRAEIKHIPLVVANNQLELPFLTVRITDDLSEAIENPSIIMVKEINKGGRVYSDKH